MTLAPEFIPLKSMISAELIDDGSYKLQNKRVFRIVYSDQTQTSEVCANGDNFEMLLTSDTVSQVIEWCEMVKRLRQLYTDSKQAIVQVVGKRKNGINLFDNSE